MQADRLLPRVPLTLLNGDTARFECLYNRGCEGSCCKNGRPPVSLEQQQRIEGSRHRWLPLLRVKARGRVEREGWLGRRIKAGERMVRVEGQWCVFFNNGCVLHSLEDGESGQRSLKPEACALFPLEKAPQGQWFVRQHGFRGEQWGELACLAGKPETPLGIFTLTGEMKLAEELDTRNAKTVAC